MILDGEVAFLVDLGKELPVPGQVPVVAGVDGVLGGLLPKLEGEEGVLAPGYVLLNVNLVLKVKGLSLSFQGS